MIQCPHEDRGLHRNRYLVTGAARFIGANIAQALLEAGCEVVGVDNLNDYYDVGLKQYRLNPLLDHSRFSFVQGDLSDFAQFNCTRISPEAAATCPDQRFRGVDILTE